MIFHGYVSLSEGRLYILQGGVAHNSTLGEKITSMKPNYKATVHL